jgi:hypothetical protein
MRINPDGTFTLEIGIGRQIQVQQGTNAEDHQDSRFLGQKTYSKMIR